MEQPTLYRRPWRLQVDNFTPPTRTPWGGQNIVGDIKAELALPPDKRAYSVVGESWEVSVEPSFPSRVVDVAGGPLLQSLIAADPEAALGRPLVRRFGGLPLLVKLLDAAQNLSVQVHPDLDCELLAPHQSGKPEAWLILAAVEGAGLYLGFRDGVSANDVRLALGSQEDLTPMLNFVPVGRGDCFQIAAGTVHAIGGGVTLLEPQHVVPGKEAVTYRFWDWNRRYDTAGRLSDSGSPRQLHQAESLAVASFDATGETLVDSLRRSPRRVLTATSGCERETLLSDDLFRLDRLRGTGSIEIQTPSMVAATVLEGTMTCSTDAGTATFQRGESFVVPSAAGCAQYDMRAAEVALSWSTP